MEISIIGQSAEFLLAMLYGLLTGVLYDVIRAVRGRIKAFFVIFALDLLFWVCCVIGVFWFAMGIGQGELRLFVFSGIVLANVLYFSVFSRFIRSFLFDLLEIIASVIAALLKPFVEIAKKIQKVAQKTKKSFQYWEKRNKIKEELYASARIRRRMYKRERRVTPHAETQKRDIHKTMYRGVRNIRGIDAPDFAGADERAQSFRAGARAAAGLRAAEERAAESGYRI